MTLITAVKIGIVGIMEAFKFEAIHKNGMIKMPNIETWPRSFNKLCDRKDKGKKDG